MINIITNNINHSNDSGYEIRKLELENEKLRLIIEAKENGCETNNETNFLYLCTFKTPTL